MDQQLHNYTESEVLKLWNDAVGKLDEFILQKGKYIDNVDGGVLKEFVALVHKVNGSVVAQVNGQATQDALNALAANAGKSFIHNGVVPANEGDQNMQPGTVEVPGSPQPGYAGASTVQTSDATPEGANPPATTPTAQQALAGKQVDVSDVTPEPGQSQEEAQAQAAGAGTAVSTQNNDLPVGTGSPAPTGGEEPNADENPGDEAGDVPGDTVGA